jgi:hypothetical protein
MRIAAPDEVDGDDRSESDRRALAYTRHAVDAIGNVSTRMRLLDTNDHLIPLSINEGAERIDNSYVVSPLTAYTGYAAYEVGQLGRPLLEALLRQLIKGVEGWLERSHIDRIVQVNNWLLSTNLYPSDWSHADLSAITRLLVDTYPDYAIGFRSLNRYCNLDLISQLEALGYVSIPSRQVYLFDAAGGFDSAYLQRRDCRNDARLLARTGYVQVPGEDLADAEYARIEQLYNLLYLEKYSPLNPHFSADWLRAGQRDGWLRLTALRSPTGRIDAALGWFASENILTTPVVGYDTALPQKLGLYRLIAQISLEEAARRQCLLNMSAGAAHFKRMRGGQAEIEYSFVYVNHLPRQRQRVWRVLGHLLHTVGVPVMKRLKL